MIEVEALDISHWITRYVYPFARISGLLMVMPLIGTRMVSMRVRLLLAVAVTLVVVPLLPPIPKVEAISLASVIIILQQLLIGILLGFVTELLMQVFVIAGQLIAMQTGLGIATKGATILEVLAGDNVFAGLEVAHDHPARGRRVPHGHVCLGVSAIAGDR